MVFSRFNKRKGLLSLVGAALVAGSFGLGMVGNVEATSLVWNGDSGCNIQTKIDSLHYEFPGGPDTLFVAADFGTSPTAPYYESLVINDPDGLVMLHVDDSFVLQGPESAVFTSVTSGVPALTFYDTEENTEVQGFTFIGGDMSTGSSVRFGETIVGGRGGDGILYDCIVKGSYWGAYIVNESNPHFESVLFSDNGNLNGRLNEGSEPLVRNCYFALPSSKMMESPEGSKEATFYHLSFGTESALADGSTGNTFESGSGKNFSWAHTRNANFSLDLYIGGNDFTSDCPDSLKFENVGGAYTEFRPWIDSNGVPQWDCDDPTSVEIESWGQMKQSWSILKEVYR